MHPANEDRPLLEFPCSFPLKVMGQNANDFAGFVFTLLQKHVPGLQPDALALRSSREGRFLSITITFTAHSQEQLDAIYRDLSAHPRVLMAL